MVISAGGEEPCASQHLIQGYIWFHILHSVHREEMLTLLKGSLFIQVAEDGLEDKDDGVRVRLIIRHHKSGQSPFFNNLSIST